MKNTSLLVLASILTFMFFLVAKMPANQVISRVTLPENISVTGVSGTLWNGNATQLLYNGLQVLDVNWHLDFLPLLIGRASLSIDAGSTRNPESIAFNGEVALSRNHLSINDGTLFAPAPLLLAQVQLPLPVSAKGRVKVEIDALEYANEGCETLMGKGFWLNGEVAGLQEQIALGNFEATLYCDNGPVEVTTNPENSLNMASTVTIHHNGKFALTGKFKPEDSLSKEVHGAARNFFEVDNEGFYSIDL